ARGVLRPSRSLTPRIVERSRRRHDAGDTRRADAELFDSRGYTDGSKDVPDGRWDVCGRVGASLEARAPGNDPVPCVHERLMVEPTDPIIRRSGHAIGRHDRLDEGERAREHDA